MKMYGSGSFFHLLPSIDWLTNHNATHFACKDPQHAKSFYARKYFGISTSMEGKRCHDKHRRNIKLICIGSLVQIKENYYSKSKNSRQKYRPQ